MGSTRRASRGSDWCRHETLDCEKSAGSCDRRAGADDERGAGDRSNRRSTASRTHVDGSADARFFCRACSDCRPRTSAFVFNDTTADWFVSAARFSSDDARSDAQHAGSVRSFDEDARADDPAGHSSFRIDCSRAWCLWQTPACEA